MQITFLETLTSVLAHIKATTTKLKMEKREVCSPCLGMKDVCLLLYNTSLTTGGATRQSSQRVLQSMGLRLADSEPMHSSHQYAQKQQDVTTDIDHHDIESKKSQLCRLTLSVCLGMDLGGSDLTSRTAKEIHCAGILTLISWVLGECQTSDLQGLSEIVSWIHEVTVSRYHQVAGLVKACLTRSAQGLGLTEQIVQIYSQIYAAGCDGGPTPRAVYCKTLGQLNELLAHLAVHYTDKNTANQDPSFLWRVQQIRNYVEKAPQNSGDFITNCT